jgi:hypoxanthine phosphoribosyltransferase
MAKPVTGADVEVLYSAEEIAVRNEHLAAEIAAAIGGDFVIVAILKGSCLFIADLLRALYRCGASPEVDFMSLSSYGDGMTSRGTVSVIRDLQVPVNGRPVLIVDDILETGRTLAHAKDLIAARGASHVYTCVLLDKPVPRAADLSADFRGFTCPDKFVVGYGMDVAQRLRELPFIGWVKPRD